MNARVLCVFLAASLAPFAVGCDGDKKDGDKKADAKKDGDKKADKKGDDKKADAKADAKADEKKAEPAKPKVMACDQRDFVPEMAKKMAAELKKEPEPKRVCMDYSKRTGPGSGSCMQGTALETPCPDEDVVGTCTLSNGVVYKHYKGVTLTLAEKSCGTIEGTFAKVE